MEGPPGGPRPYREDGFVSGGPRPGFDASSPRDERRPMPPVIVVVVERNRDGAVNAREIADALAAARGVEMNGEGRPARHEFYPPRPRWNLRDAQEEGRPPGPPMGPRNHPDRGPDAGPNHGPDRAPRNGPPGGPQGGPEDGPLPPPRGE
jgi:hypothetical protein